MSRVMRRAFFGALLLGLMAGCSAPVQVTASNRDSSYQGKITRVLVVTSLQVAHLSTLQNEGFVRISEIRQALNATWGPLGIPFEITDRSSMAEATARFAPQQVLTLSVEGGTLYQGVLDSYTVDAALLDVSTDKRIWRTKVLFNSMTESGRIRHNGFGGSISHQIDADDLVRALTEKLKADRLL